MINLEVDVKRCNHSVYFLEKQQGCQLHTSVLHASILSAWRTEVKSINAMHYLRTQKFQREHLMSLDKRHIGDIEE